ncbi:MAG: argininosuccinate synthase, partial [Treponema sp.]|nr:argininosuccinate synthase [Treponema sp.]
IIPWLKENYDCEVIAVCVDVGQDADWKDIKSRALKTGASVCHIADVKKEYVEEYIWPTLKAGAVYEDKYLLGTATARPLIAKTLVEYARREKAQAVAHGATGKGNDQVRFDLGLIALAPDLEIIAPWRIWKINSREAAMRYLVKRNIPIPMSRKSSYSRDDNIWHMSHEGLELEDPSVEPQLRKMLVNTVPPEKAPNKASYVDLEFERGVPVALNGKKTDGLALIRALNKIGGENGIGIADLVENRVVGMKCRGVYETPGGSILYYAHRELEHLCLDRQTYAFKQQVGLKMSELIYGGLWFTPLREALAAFVESTQSGVSGKVRLKLYKGSISSAGATSPNSLYNDSIASFTTGDLYSHADAKGFVRLYGLPILVRSLMELDRKKGDAKEAPKSAGKPRGRGTAKK